MARSFTLFRASLLAAVFGVAAAASSAQTGGLPTDRVFQGQVRLPDFAGRDRRFANFRTRIREGMGTGPDFAGHYAIVQIGCGAGCNFAVMGDVATGRLYDFPYGGEAHQHMQIFRSVKSDVLTVVWDAGGRCYRDGLTWNGSSFASDGKVELGPSEICDRL